MLWLGELIDEHIVEVGDLLFRGIDGERAPIDTRSRPGGAIWRRDSRLVSGRGATVSGKGGEEQSDGLDPVVVLVDLNAGHSLAGDTATALLGGISLPFPEAGFANPYTDQSDVAFTGRRENVLTDHILLNRYSVS